MSLASLSSSRVVGGQRLAVPKVRRALLKLRCSAVDAFVLALCCGFVGWECHSSCCVRQGGPAGSANSGASAAAHAPAACSSF